MQTFIIIPSTQVCTTTNKGLAPKSIQVITLATVHSKTDAANPTQILWYLKVALLAIFGELQ